MTVDFLIVGAQKSGTTALHQILNNHSEINAPYELKDKKIFNEDSLVNHSEDIKSKKYLLASNVNYCRQIEPLKLAKENNPKMKVIFIYRNPIQRIKSAFQYSKERSLIQNDVKLLSILNRNLTNENDFLENQLSFIESTKYGKILSNLYSVFDPSQIIVCEYEYFLKNSKQFLIDIQIALDLSNIENLDNIKSNVTKGGYHLKFVNSILFDKSNKIRIILRKLIKHTGIKQKKKIRDLVRKINQKEKTNYDLTKEEVDFISNTLRKDQIIFTNLLTEIPKRNKILNG